MAFAGMRRVLITVCFTLCGYFKCVYCVKCPDSICPENLPYCTPLGCVFQCPNGSFTEGQMCKADCGVKYILNDQCVDVCPNTAPFLQTEIVKIGHHFVKFQYCRSTCPSGTYTFENTCLPSCPPDNKFADGGVCKSACPRDDYLVNVTVNGQLTAIECVSQCDEGQFIRNSYCVNTCYSGQVIYKDNCQSDCPPDAPIQDNVESGFTFCTSNCTDSKRKYNQHGRCVSKCDDGLVSVKGVCRGKCPDDMKLKYIDRLGIIHCTNSCSIDYMRLFVEDGYCVRNCKRGNMNYHDTSCVKQCPEDAPVEDRYYNALYCKTNCDMSGVFLYNNTCVDVCPRQANHRYNKTCFNECPKKAPYRNDEGNISSDYRLYTCYEKCPSSLKTYQFNCTKMCPHNTYKYYFNNSCWDKCPEDIPFIRYGMCVPFCSDYVFNKTCVSKCPNEAPYAIFESKGELNKRCVEKCPSLLKTYKFTCVHSCPPQTYTFQDSCFDNCTGSAPFISDSTCVHTCPDGTLPKNGVCKLDCTASPYIAQNGSCVDQCQTYEVIDGNKCINRTKCEKAMIYQEYCIDICPVDHFYNGNEDSPCTATLGFKIGIGVLAPFNVCLFVAIAIWLSKKNFNGFCKSLKCCFYCQCHVQSPIEGDDKNAEIPVLSSTELNDNDIESAVRSSTELNDNDIELDVRSSIDISDIRANLHVGSHNEGFDNDGDHVESIV